MDAAPEFGPVIEPGVDRLDGADAPRLPHRHNPLKKGTDYFLIRCTSNGEVSDLADIAQTPSVFENAFCETRVRRPEEGSSGGMRIRVAA
jgi:hypothetical protein